MSDDDDYAARRARIREEHADDEPLEEGAATVEIDGVVFTSEGPFFGFPTLSKRPRPRRAEPDDDWFDIR